MKNAIALLRGINVSGQKKIKMAELRDSLSNAGLQNVQTYIQSGNIVFDSESDDKEYLQGMVQSIILKDFGFEVPTLIINGKDVNDILKANPFSDDGENRLYYVLLKNAPAEDEKSAFNALQFENEDFHMTDACVYLFCKKGYGNAKLNNNLIERKLKVEATTRNHKTMLKLLEMTT